MPDPAQSIDIVTRLVDAARAAGADAADAVRLMERSTGVGVRLGALEDVHRSESESVGLRVFRGLKSASVAASASDPDTLAALVERAMAMAGEASEDPYAGLADAALMMAGPIPDLDLDDGSDPEPASLRERAMIAEDAARAVEGVSNSNGASASASASLYAFANSHGFAGATRGSGHSVSASMIAGSGGAMRRDYSWHSARHLADLEDAADVGARAGRRAVERLGQAKVAAGPIAVILEPRVATSLLGHLLGAINGAAVARDSSFLAGKLGEAIFADGVTIRDDPLRPRGLRSRGVDGEGLATKAATIVEDGRLLSWLADSASARQLGIAPTGHAVRGASGGPGAAPSNLWLEPGARDVATMIAAHDRVFYVTELIGQGVNIITGDYSRGAAGFYYEKGERVGPISEVTIAGTLQAMFASLEPASDLAFRRGIDSPSILVPEMTLATG